MCNCIINKTFSVSFVYDHILKFVLNVFLKEKIFIQFFYYKKLPIHSNSDHEISKNLDIKEK